MNDRIDPETAAREILAERYDRAAVLFLAGSVLRGEATAYSDLDLVVVYERIDRAFRQSFIHKDWPVEVFVHDPQTLKYFFVEVDAKSGCPSLPGMILEAVALPSESALSLSLKSLARDVVDRGPPALSSDELDRRRYAITDLLDDIREPRSNDELTASGAKLYELLADYYFRSNGLWSASGKTIVRRLQAVDRELAKRYCTAFGTMFAGSDPAEVIALAGEILAGTGGELFDGYRLEAPPDWRLD